MAFRAAKLVRFDELYNDPSLTYIVKNIENQENPIERFKSLVCVCIDWGSGYPMSGIKLGKARDSPFYKQEEINKNGLYTEREFNKLWKQESIKVFNTDGVRYIPY